ncbi:MerR family transcriptional regulator [Teichococcus oryzae]|uniref:Helix-turn-helix domain-containing protein n=1 Tax=Teichococcus oryzae TaxID=1608942 RepID=A0A5B2TA40_9PROT|nr:helix-turn-helix domain-containing protein [Pseudoroseomonas oryzae]KAA2211446.1 helix-turn-helix domain-containing protein [Pseudoroseomonas oryzae]
MKMHPKRFPGSQPPCGGFTIKGACEWSGLSRTALYRAASSGQLLLRKAGRTTIVDGASLAALIEGLPFASKDRS